MKSLYFIPCRFRLVDGGTNYDGFAICSSPDDVITFVYADGTPYNGMNVWDFTLLHHLPWGKFDVN